MSNFLLAFSVGYVFGCFQTSYFLSKKFINKDIRKMGSGNAGASNVTSEMCLKFGIITAILDILKAYLPVKLILIIFPTASQQIELMVIAGTAAILGHIFPFFMNFKGGKGIASYLGVLLGIDLQLCGIVMFSNNYYKLCRNRFNFSLSFNSNFDFLLRILLNYSYCLQFNSIINWNIKTYN